MHRTLPPDFINSERSRVMILSPYSLSLADRLSGHLYDRRLHPAQIELQTNDLASSSDNRNIFEGRSSISFTLSGWKAPG